MNSSDFQKAGEFFYSQRYTELSTSLSSPLNKGKWQIGQHLLLSLHHIVNGFGERWLRAFVWFVITLFGFAFFAYTPNKDFISTKSTPEYFLNAYKNPYYQNTNNEENTIANLRFDDSNFAKYIFEKKDFMLLASVKNRKDEQNKTIFAYDNRFDYHYTEQYIPMLKNDDTSIFIAHSLSKMIAPFISEEKKWFQDRSEKAYYLGFLETILLWIFFLAFVFAVKNRIRR